MARIEDAGVGKFASLRFVNDDGSWHPIEVWGVSPKYRFREKPNMKSKSWGSDFLPVLLRMYEEEME